MTAQLSADRRTLVVTRRLPSGIQTATYRSDRPDGFTDEDVAKAAAFVPTGQKQPGQRNISRRATTRFGTLWTHVMLGPPTWWLPKLRLEADGTVMLGWLRAAVAVRFERSGSAT